MAEERAVYSVLTQNAFDTFEEIKTILRGYELLSGRRFQIRNGKKVPQNAPPSLQDLVYRRVDFVCNRYRAGGCRARFRVNQVEGKLRVTGKDLKHNHKEKLKKCFSIAHAGTIYRTIFPDDMLAFNFEGFMQRVAKFEKATNCTFSKLFKTKGTKGKYVYLKCTRKRDCVSSIGALVRDNRVQIYRKELWHNHKLVADKSGQKEVAIKAAGRTLTIEDCHDGFEHVLGLLHEARCASDVRQCLAIMTKMKRKLDALIRA